MDSDIQSQNHHSCDKVIERSENARVEHFFYYKLLVELLLLTLHVTLFRFCKSQGLNEIHSKLSCPELKLSN